MPTIPHQTQCTCPLTVNYLTTSTCSCLMGTSASISFLVNTDILSPPSTWTLPDFLPQCWSLEHLYLTSLPRLHSCITDTLCQPSSLTYKGEPFGPSFLPQPRLPGFTMAQDLWEAQLTCTRIVPSLGKAAFKVPLGEPIDRCQPGAAAHRESSKDPHGGELGEPDDRVGGRLLSIEHLINFQPESCTHINTQSITRASGKDKGFSW